MSEARTLNYRPLYEQIKSLLVRRLGNNEWPPGTALPSEIALAQEYDVSQGTVRKALTAMEKEHLVERRQGRGTFAARHSQQRSLFQFFHLVNDNGERELPISRVTRCLESKASATEARALELSAHAMVVQIERVRELNGTPVIYESITIPSSLFPGLSSWRLEDLPNTLYEFYETEYGVMVVHASEMVRAAAASATEAELLGVAPASPLLSVERRALNIRNEPVEWRRSLCHTGHHYYFNELD